MKSLTLPSGKVAQIRDGVGRDLLNAQRKAQRPDEVTLALTAELLTVDGGPVIYEDLLDWPLADVAVLITEVAALFPNSPPTPSASSTSLG